jgi:glycosyltransferase involved in cell wall biosynthesis
VAPVAPATGSFPELIDNDVDGRLFDGGADGLADALTHVDRDPAHFLELGARAIETYRTRFHPKPNLDRLLEIYEYAVTHPRVAP